MQVEPRDGCADVAGAWGMGGGGGRPRKTFFSSRWRSFLGTCKRFTSSSHRVNILTHCRSARHTGSVTQRQQPIMLVSHRQDETVKTEDITGLERPGASLLYVNATSSTSYPPMDPIYVLLSLWPHVFPGQIAIAQHSSRPRRSIAEFCRFESHPGNRAKRRLKRLQECRTNTLW